MQTKHGAFADGSTAHWGKAEKENGWSITVRPPDADQAAGWLHNEQVDEPLTSLNVADPAICLLLEENVDRSELRHRHAAEKASASSVLQTPLVQAETSKHDATLTMVMHLAPAHAGQSL